jgi:60 kDa SS-A/Ro ribonucleoprotein
MSKLNLKGVNPVNVNNAVSFNGNPQKLKGFEQELFELVVASVYGGDSFYETADTRLDRLKAAVANVVASGNLDFIANTAVYARNVFNMRTMPVVLTVLFAEQLRAQKKTYAHLRKLVSDVISRADEITDLTAFALNTFGDKKSMPMAVRRGVADAFNKFSEYQFGKYNRDGAVKLRDALFITHPKAKSPEQGAVFEKIRDQSLTVPYTWETELSRNGQLPVAERKSNKDLWTELLNSDKLGYMALLRNLRNIHEAGVSEDVLDAKVYSVLADPAQVAKSKQLPFRFVSAFDNVTQFTNTKLNRALSKALDASFVNMPTLGENVWLILDVSLSMKSLSYGQGNTSRPWTEVDAPIYKAALFAAAMFKVNGAKNIKLTVFSDRAEHLNINPEDSILTIRDNIRKSVYGGGTDLSTALSLSKTLGFTPDAVVVMSDMQVNHNSLSAAAQRINALFDKNTVKIAFNFGAYESTPIGEVCGWYQLAGWSERVFDFIPAMRGSASVVKLLSKPYIGLADIKNAVVGGEALAA